MLDDKASSAIVAVRDIDRARDFYERILGLQLASDAMGVLVFHTGPTSLVVYPSGEVGSNRANAVVWGCGSDIDAIVAALAAKGVVFEHYPELDGAHLDGDLHVAGSMKLAWFKDPDGNLLHLNNF